MAKITDFSHILYTATLFIHYIDFRSNRTENYQYLKEEANEKKNTATNSLSHSRTRAYTRTLHNYIFIYADA